MGNVAAHDGDEITANKMFQKGDNRYHGERAAKDRLIKGALSGLDESDDGSIDPETLADYALDAAVAYIQEALGVESGDVAAEFFMGKNGTIVTDIFVDYIMTEKRFKEDDSNLQEDEDTDLYMNQIKKIRARLLKIPGFSRRVSDETSQIKLAEKIFNDMKRGMSFDSALVLAQKSSGLA